MTRAMRSGEVVKSLVEHQRPSGISGFVMNTRRAPFDDWRVRDALIHAFNFEFINNAINAGEQPRITSYYSNSVLGMEDGPADRAGIREGDLITHINGQSLLEPLEEQQAEEEMDLDSSIPSQRLLHLARELEPGDEVVLTVERAETSPQ
mgnify:CR=1 FL=1